MSERHPSARDAGFAAALRAAVQGEVREAESLAKYSTYRIGGPATVLLPKSAEDVAVALQRCSATGVPWFTLGLGSNLLLPDDGLDALVIRIGRGLDHFEALDQNRWRIGAGLPQPLAARRTAETGVAGLHRFVGVPGSVGGGVYMNAGCHGGEWSDVVESVTVLEPDGQVRLLPRSDVPFRYRSSGLSGRVVVETVVQLTPTDPAALQEEIGALFRWRQDGTPFNQPCCGSVFKNPGGASWGRSEGARTAGQLLEAAGLKGFRLGGVEVSQLHANYFVNVGGATAADVRRVMMAAQARVRDAYGAVLEPEVKLIGPDGTYAELSEP